ncbi:hypothetical protein VNO78_20313 [Psophocarpus tetragonolobus]|uniref:Uncharacterized protein n=1 Tax=Psophocarpus tetragonolobus TaxID=3891 RepID=A0AAN9SA37_PSOTE
MYYYSFSISSSLKKRKCPEIGCMAHYEQDFIWTPTPSSITGDFSFRGVTKTLCASKTKHNVDDKGEHALKAGYEAGLDSIGSCYGFSHTPRYFDGNWEVVVKANVRTTLHHWLDGSQEPLLVPWDHMPLDPTPWPPFQSRTYALVENYQTSTSSA